MNFFGKILIRKIILLLTLLLLSCGKNEISRNPNLSKVKFNVSVNLNLPSNDNLRFTGGSSLLTLGGINGILLFNLNGTYLAWEASCPNHPVKNCSKLNLKGVLAECDCEGFRYSLAVGQLLNPDENTTLNFPLMPYRINQSGNTLYISDWNFHKIRKIKFYWY